MQISLKDTICINVHSSYPEKNIYGFTESINRVYQSLFFSFIIAFV